MAIWKICANCDENVLAQFHAVRIANGPRFPQRFFAGSNATRKISSFGVSRSERSEKSGVAPIRELASALGKANCLGAIARI
jgi:hypothetical protein